MQIYLSNFSTSIQGSLGQMNMSLCAEVKPSTENGAKYELIMHNGMFILVLSIFILK